MNFSKLLTENSDAVFKINQPGKAQFFELQDNVKNMGLKNKGYFVTGLNKNEFDEFLKTEVKNKTNIVFLFTESYSDDKNLDEVKQAVDMVKSAGMQAVVVVNTHNNKAGVPSSEITYYSSQEELFKGLESMFDVNLSAKNDITAKIGNIRDKLDEQSSGNNFKFKG